MEKLITVSGLAKAYETHQVYTDLNLELFKGECFTLLGPSGCGKTVLIRLLAGHEVPDKGKIELGDTVLADSATGAYIPPERRGLGVVFQDYAVWPHMTVFENIAVIPILHAVPDKGKHPTVVQLPSGNFSVERNVQFIGPVG
mgnify:CR=1 FL=1